MPTKIKLVSPLTLAIAAASLAACKYPYPGDVGSGDATAACTPSTTTCTNDTLTVCDAAGQPMSTTACAFGCFASGDRCADLEPSNGLAAYLDQARTAAPLVLTGPAELNTDSATLMDGAASVPITTAVVAGNGTTVLVLFARSFEAEDVSVVGTRALAILTDGDVLLHGTLSVSARAPLGFGVNIPGPGARTKGDPVCTAGRGAFNATGYSGAGGGGHGTAGGGGGSGNGAVPGAGGIVTGSVTLVPLFGGCPGEKAWGMEGQEGTPSGGAGGGAVQISARGRILVDPGAAITANGAGASGVLRNCPFMAGDAPGCNAGSGGGAGGGILLEAADLEVQVSGGIAANGGGGNCLFTGQGTSGLLSEAPASGQDCSASPETGSGGRGGAASLPAGDGGDGTVTGGGGGGGVGRIRINLPVGVAFDPGPPIVSPAPSLGQGRTR